MERSTRTTLFTAATLCLCTATATAQGADDCSGAQPIAGTGAFSYDTLTATTDGPPESFWSIPGLDNMDNDVWFSWQAPTTSVYEVSNCLATNTMPTFIAIYAYGCSAGPGRAIAARDFGCGAFAFTTLEFGTQAGATYLIRIGHSVPVNRDAGTFTISEVPHPGILGTAVNPANGHTYHVLEPSSWTIAQAAAEVLGGNLVTVNDQAENDWLDATFSNWGGQPTSFWIGYSDAENEGTWKWASGETPGYENWSPGAPSNGNQYEHYAHFRYDWTDGTWNDLLGYPRAGFFYDTVHGVVEISEDGIGTPYCGPANLNSAGLSAEISASGSTFVVNNDLTLGASSMPANKFAYFINSQTQGFVANPGGSQGNLCLGGGIGRHTSQIGSTGAGGTFSIPVDLTIVPTPSGPTAVLAGETWNWQCWYRDNNPDPTSNFTDGVSILFQ